MIFYSRINVRLIVSLVFFSGILSGNSTHAESPNLANYNRCLHDCNQNIGSNCEVACQGALPQGEVRNIEFSLPPGPELQFPAQLQFERTTRQVVPDPVGAPSPGRGTRPPTAQRQGGTTSRTAVLNFKFFQAGNISYH